MHRSGTSLVAQLLHALGLDLGPEEHLMGPSPANPAGHWENEPISELNDELLERLGGSWYDPPELAPGWEDSRELDDLRRRARQLIESEFSDSERWAFKDPRACLTLPFWQRLVPPMRYVLCLRNPVDVALSLEAREVEPIPFEQGADLWLRYVRAALTGTAVHPQEILFYEDMMENPERVVRRLVRFAANGGGDAAKAHAAAAVRVAVSQGLWHHRSPVASVIEESRLRYETKSLYLALRLFAPGAEKVRGDALELLGRSAVASRADHTKLERWLSERNADLDTVMQARREERQRLETELAAARAELEQARADAEAARGAIETVRAEVRQLRPARHEPDAQRRRHCRQGRRPTLRARSSSTR